MSFEKKGNLKETNHCCGCEKEWNSTYHQNETTHTEVNKLMRYITDAAFQEIFCFCSNYTRNARQGYDLEEK